MVIWMSNTKTKGDVAIAHKDYAVRGGGERLVEHLAQALNCPLYVGRDDPEKRGYHDVRELDHRRSQRWLIDRGGILRTIGYMSAWQEAEELTDYDVVVTSGNEPLWYPPKDHQTHIAYTHTTPRFQYDLFHEGEYGFIGTYLKTAMRTLYLPNIRYPDIWIANSDVVARRINLYYNIPENRIRTVYPPVQVDEYDPDAGQTAEYYLYLGRLAGHKRVDDLIEGLGETNIHLRIAGQGPEHDRLQRMAPQNVDMLGYVSEETKRKLLAGAKGLLFPAANEDFGMVPIEAMASGTPVIGVDEGMTQYQIRDGENGILCNAGPDGFRKAVDRYERENVDWTPEQIAAWAREHFGVPQFVEQMKAIIDEAQEMSAIDADLPAPPSIKKGSEAKSTVTDGGVNNE